jgi:hypothetical protein
MAPTSVATSSATASTATASPTILASPTATGVPVDQIPPGRPASWVPTGVPTVAPWKEPGDVLPTFSPLLFGHDVAGAYAAAFYYRDSRNWALATLSAQPYLAICDASKCASDATALTAARIAQQHVTGSRLTFSAARLVRPPAAVKAEWVFQSRQTYSDGAVVSSSGNIVLRTKATSFVANLHLQWNGRMWRVSDVFIAGKPK